MVVAEEKSLIREFDEQVMANRQKTINRAIWEKIFIDFINSKIDQELEENEIKDRILYAVEINKMIVKNDYRKATEKKLMEIKEAVSQFDKLFDKITRAGLPSCWGVGGSLLSWDSYENLLVLKKSKVYNTHQDRKSVV